MFTTPPKDTVAVTGAEAPVISTRTPVILNDPDGTALVFAVEKPGKSNSILLRLVLILRPVTPMPFGFPVFANRPLAPTIEIGSSAGTPAVPPLPEGGQPVLKLLFVEKVLGELPAPLRLAELEMGLLAPLPEEVSQIVDDDESTVGYEMINVVVVRGELAITAPVTRMPPPGVDGSLVCEA